MGYDSPEAAAADPVSMSKQCLYQLELLLAQQSAPEDTAAICLEPVLGEGGYCSAPAEFLEGLQKICEKHGILLIIDEVQSGYFFSAHRIVQLLTLCYSFGRTGSCKIPSRGFAHTVY